MGAQQTKANNEVLKALQDLDDDFTDKFQGLDKPSWFHQYTSSNNKFLKDLLDNSSKLSKEYEVFNPACVPFNGHNGHPPTEFLLLGRGFHSPPGSGTSNWLGASSQIVAKCTVTNGKCQWTEPKYLKYEDGSHLHMDAEDPRLFQIHDGSVLCWWNQPPPKWQPDPKNPGNKTHRSIYYSKVNVNTFELEWGKATEPWQAKLDCQKDFEKYWMPFSYKGIDYICYDLEPLTIYQYDWVKGKQVKNGPEVVEDWRQNTKAFEQMRKFFNKADAKFSGGTPGIFLQEFDYVDSTGSFHFVEWLFVGHIWINHSPTGAGEYKAPDRKKDIHLKKQHNTWHQDYPKQYVAFYFTITLETKSGKFFIDRVSRGVGMPNAKYEPTKIIFPTGLVRLSEELFLVTYGEADCYCRKYVVKKSDLDHLLQKSGTFAEDEKHLFLRARGLAYDNMHWTPSPLDKFNLIMKPSDLVLDGIQAEKLQVKHLTGDDNQAFHFKNNAGGM